MSALGRFFRHCPSCGRRFEIRLVSKNEVGDEGETWRAKEYALSLGTRKESNLLLESDHPATVEAQEVEEIKEFRYNYKCKHCGHEWSEERVETTRHKGDPGYKGD